jgi:hypothetical protein
MVELDPWFYDNNFWSFSKHRIWHQCQKQYYYTYIAPFLKQSPHFDIQKIKYLKMFKSRIFLQGDLIHNILEDQINCYLERKSMDSEGSIQKFIKKVSQYKTMAPEVLTEYRHGKPVDDQFFLTLQKNGISCLSTFFETVWPTYAELEYLRHEAFDRFTINSINVMVKADYVSKDVNGLIVISDWKTGLPNEMFENELQIASYVIWATQYFSKDPNEIKSDLVYLNTGEIRSFIFVKEQLLEVEEKIKSDFKTMNFSYEYEDFLGNPEPNKCLSCKFGSICPESKMSEVLKNKD